MSNTVRMLCPRCQQEIVYRVMDWGFSGDCKTCWSGITIQTGIVPKPVMDTWKAN